MESKLTVPLLTALGGENVAVSNVQLGMLKLMILGRQVI